MDNDERTELSADLKTATLSGGGLGLAMLGWMIPVLSPISLIVCYLGWRSARPEYRLGRVFAVAGMVVAILGMGMMVTEFLN